MVLHVDLTGSDLLPDAVILFIEQHVGTSDILFKVNKNVMDSVHSARRESFVEVSENEAQEMNSFFGKSYKPSEYKFLSDGGCSNCNRETNFYDIFKSGINKHGADYVRRFLGGDECHYHSLNKENEVEIKCTSCGAGGGRLLAYYNPVYYCNSH